MKPLSEFKAFLGSTSRISSVNAKDVRGNPGHDVGTFPTLVRRVAELSFHNPEYVLFFRGQNRDYRNSKRASTFYPAMFRSSRGHTLPWGQVVSRFRRLERAEEMLIRHYDLEGQITIRRYQIIRWAILQHYEVCATPLIDLTQSLRVACSFAQYGAEGLEKVFVYAFGMPQVGGAVTASSSDGIQMIRLLGICPADALRPHHQEGYLAGEFPTVTIATKREYPRRELDFSRRLLAKFRIPSGHTFWPAGYQPYPWEALFPDANDKLKRIADRIGARGL